MSRTARIFHQALTKALVQDDYAKLHAIAARLVAAAEAGEGWAIKEVADRTDGKPAQAVTVGNEEGENFRIEKVIREIVRPQNPDG